MGFRIGTFIFTPTVLFLPLAIAFFLALSRQRLYANVSRTRRHAHLALAAAVVGGVFGAWACGWLGALGIEDPRHAWLSLRFGSFGGYWGALAGAMAYAALTRQSVLRHADALVPGILAGGCVARLGCMFTGCCQGIWVGPDPPNGFQPFRPWPAYDVAALLVTLALVHIASSRRTRVKAPGYGLCSYLTIYGVLRFTLEFARDSDAFLWRLTPGQVAALVQAMVGAGLILWIRASARAGRATRAPRE